jgi:hypothetical protein
MNSGTKCTRCGKPRKLEKTWTEEIEVYGQTSKVTHSLYVCADPACQEIVDGKLADLKQASIDRTQASLQRESDRKEALARSQRNRTAKVKA